MNNIMEKIYTSATKLVLLAIMIVLCILSLVAGVYAVVTGTFSEAAKVILALFASTVSYIVGYYFGSKGDPTLPLAGK